MATCAYKWMAPVPEKHGTGQAQQTCCLEQGHRGGHRSLGGVTVPADEVLVKNLPMYVNLGDIGTWESIIGRAQVTRNSETGQNKIEITLDEAASTKLGDMVDVFDLKAIGFAGIKKRPINETES